MIPYADLAGSVNCFALRRPHNPPIVDNKPLKYIAPKGEPSRPYFPAECRTALLDPDADLFLTEGPLKALALAQIGFAVVALAGVWNWKVAGTEELLPELADVPLTGRDVYIVFDYDQKPDTQQQVAEARRRLARALLKARAAEVRNVSLPPGPNGTKQGVNDFLVAHGADAFRELVACAEPMTAESVEVIPLRNPEGHTDTDNGYRFVAKHGEDARYVGPWEKWLLWDGARWKHDQLLAIDKKAKQVAEGMVQEARALLKSAKDEDAKKLALKALDFAISTKDMGGLRAMLAAARSELAIGPDVLDRDPWLLNVENGTLDLTSGELRPHDKADWITKLAPVAYDPDAECPVWLSFLDTIFASNAELIGYMQRLIGYALTGDTSEHILPFLFGTGANGKSTLVETVLKLLGSDYGMKAAPDLLMARRGESHPTDRADLFGKRLVACVETEEGRRMAEALTKELTGGDQIRARRMREDFWQFAPSHKVWLAGNHKPRIVGTDHGIWRRVKLIPFEVTIPDADQDKNLPAKLTAELSGILNWALAGCRDWQANGMQEPAIVRAATNEYATDEDEVGQFLSEHCDLDDSYLAAGGELFAAFQEAFPDSRLSNHAFGARLRAKGFTNRDASNKPLRDRQGRYSWRGLKRKSVVSDQQAQEMKDYLTKAKRQGNK